MHHTEHLVPAVLKKIYSSALSVEPTLIGNHTIVQTGVYSQVPGTDRRLFFGGFSCKPSRDAAIFVAPFEVAERLLATYYFSTPQLRDSEYAVLSVNTHEPRGSLKAENVILGPTVAHPKNDLDAVGLGFHGDMRKAIQHAVCELIERNILARIWYEQLPIVKLLECQLENTGYVLSAYSVSCCKAFPFVMATIHDGECNFLCLGASVSCFFSTALERATAEAIMLVDNILQKKTLLNIENEVSRARMVSQSDPAISLQRKNYLSQLCTASNVSCSDEHYSLGRLMSVLGMKADDFGYCVLQASQSGCLVRAVNSQLKTLRNYRKEFFGSPQYLREPVC